MGNILVSICCITYNHEQYIEEALSSFINQKTKFNYEIVISNDCSTDGTQKIIDSYKLKYPHLIRDISPSKNLGCIDNFYYSLKQCKGKYIAYCEGDDYWIDENKLQMQVDFLENNPEYGLCYTDYNIWNQKNKTMQYNLIKSGVNPYYKCDLLNDWIVNMGYIAPMTWVFKKDILDFDNFGSLDGTFVMVANYLANSKIQCLKDVTTAVYRKLEESASHSKNITKKYNRSVNLFDVQNKLIEKYGLSVQTKEICRRNFYKNNWKIFLAVKDENRIAESINYQRLFVKLIIFIFRKRPFNDLFRILYNSYQIMRL